MPENEEITYDVASFTEEIKNKVLQFISGKTPSSSKINVSEEASEISNSKSRYTFTISFTGNTTKETANDAYTAKEEIDGKIVTKKYSRIIETITTSYIDISLFADIDTIKGRTSYFSKRVRDNKHRRLFKPLQLLSVNKRITTNTIIYVKPEERKC